MSPLDERCLDSFGRWLGAMPSEARALCTLLESEDTPEALRQFAARAVHYLGRSIALIPEGIEDLGYLDALFAVRALAQQAVESSEELSVRDPTGSLGQLASDAELVAEFLGDDFVRLRQAVLSPGATEGSGQLPEELLTDATARQSAVDGVRRWADDYSAPSLDLGENELTKLRAFLRTKLPRATVA